MIFFFKEYGRLLLSLSISRAFVNLLISIVYSSTYGLLFFIPYIGIFILTYKLLEKDIPDKKSCAIVGFFLAVLYILVITAYFYFSSTYSYRNIYTNDFYLLIYAPLGAIYGYLHWHYYNE